MEVFFGTIRRGLSAHIHDTLRNFYLYGKFLILRIDESNTSINFCEDGHVDSQFVSLMWANLGAKASFALPSEL